jgi:anti-sigma regulatory factor (Ser/Thr protein kinase)
VGALLTGPWPGGEGSIVVRDEAAVSQVREAVRAEAAAAGLERARAESLVTAASEIAHNQVRHAHGGEMLVRRIHRGGSAGVEVLARDRGPGIADPTAALRGSGGSAGGGLGVGLSAVYRLADEVDFDVRAGEGTGIAARKFVTPIPRREVAVQGRPIQGETESGDDAGFAWAGERLLLAVADGLGHGTEAREASRRAVDLAMRSPEAPAQLLSSCHRGLHGTRGAVMAVMALDWTAGQFVHASVGNVTAHLQRDRTATRFLTTPGVLGAPGPAPRIHEESSPLAARFVLVMFTDGLSSRLDPAADPALLREPPLVIAHALMTRHARAHDDALVLVATG